MVVPDRDRNRNRITKIHTYELLREQVGANCRFLCVAFDTIFTERRCERKEDEILKIGPLAGSR